jgi:TrmH family RNA methyltransferase
MNALSPVKTPSGVVALARRPDVQLARVLQPAPPFILVAVDMQDPGNVGSLIRSAEAGGATGVVISGESADPWGWKALRAAMGSTFRLPVVVARDSSNVCDELRARGAKLIATMPRDATPMHEIDLCQSTAILLGGEGPGLSNEIVSKADARVSIPMNAAIESLNVSVSAALLVYEARRQREQARSRV